MVFLKNLDFSFIQINFKFWGQRIFNSWKNVLSFLWGGRKEIPNADMNI